MRMVSRTLYVALLSLLATAAFAQDVWDRVEHKYANNDGVKIHYAAMGKGPLVVMIHGFPDFWYSWRNQMSTLAEDYRVVAVDQRGYNLSDKPKGVDQYLMPLLVKDVVSVIKAEGESAAVVVGHDWGGAVAWAVAMSQPQVVNQLVILNLPHPNGMRREIVNNPKQRENSAYAFRFQQPDAHKSLSAEMLAGRFSEDARSRYLEAFKNSDFEAMLNYYKANYPKPDAPPAPAAAMPKVKAPVLMIHGLDDQALLPGALSGTWEWVEKDLTIVTVPGAGHFVQHDAPKIVNETIVDWLGRRVGK